MEAILRSASETSSPFMVPKEPPKTEPIEEVPRKTKGKAQIRITKIRVGPVRKFLSDSIIVALL